MTGFVWLGMIAAIPFQYQGADSLTALALDAPDSTLQRVVASRPDDTYDLVRKLLVDDRPRAASRLARAFAAVWEDSSLLRRVAFVMELPAAGRAAFREADDARREGNAALFRDGPAVARSAWWRSLTLARQIGDSIGMAGTLGNLGNGFLVEGQLDSASSYFELARRVAATQRVSRVRANAVAGLASVARLRGDLGEAADLYGRALVLHERAGHQLGVASDHNNLGVIAEESGDHDVAAASYSEALSANRRNGNRSAAAASMLNLGNLAAATAEFREAHSWYRQALASYETLDEPLNAADVLQNLGYLELHRSMFGEAADALTRAATVYHALGFLEDEIAVLLALVSVYDATGSLQRALETMRQAEALSRQLIDDGPSVEAQIALTRADLLVRFNMLEEAERAYGEASRAFIEVGDVRGQANTQQGLGLLLLLRNDHGGAQEMLTLARQASATAGDPRAAAASGLLLAWTASKRGDLAGAIEAAAEAAAIFEKLDDAASAAAALALQGDLERDLGQPLLAETHYGAGLAILARAAVPDVAWRLHAGLGRTLESRGSLREALEAYDTAVGEIERMALTLPVEDRRTMFLADKWDVYASRALLQRRMGNVAGAFETSERLRARRLLDLLARGRWGSATLPEGNVAQEEQDLRGRIAYLTTQLTESPSDLTARGPTVPRRAQDNVLREQLSDAQREYTQLLLRLREESPDYERVVTGTTRSLAEVQRTLRPTEALLEFLVSDSTTIVFVVTADTAMAVDLNVPRAALVGLVRFSRSMLRQPGSDQRGLWRTPLRRLHQMLIDPLLDTGALETVTRLIVIPHAELHYLAFDALLDGNRYLIERFEVGYAPSASVWFDLRHTDVGSERSGRVLAMAPNDERLPGSQREVAAIGQLFGLQADVLVGADATEARFRDGVADYDIIHLASYGILNKHNPLFSFVDFGWDDGVHDGRLEVHEVFGLELHARLVVLSACETGLGSGALADMPPGDDWVGLVRAFLFAGAQNVVATLWAVEDQATASFMQEFYEAFAVRGDPVAALSVAKRAAIGKSELAHPRLWAGFVTVGGV